MSVFVVGLKNTRAQRTSGTPASLGAIASAMDASSIASAIVERGARAARGTQDDEYDSSNAHPPITAPSRRLATRFTSLCTRFSV
jgi:hypothetical protein